MTMRLREEKIKPPFMKTWTAAIYTGCFSANEPGIRNRLPQHELSFYQKSPHPCQMSEGTSAQEVPSGFPAALRCRSLIHWSITPRSGLTSTRWSVSLRKFLPCRFPSSSKMASSPQPHRPIMPPSKR